MVVSANVSAGDTVLATQFNNLRTDVTNSFILEGEDTTERTTTSTSEVELSRITGLSIVAAKSLLVICSYRKTSGAADYARLTIRLNSTDIRTNPDSVTGNGDSNAQGLLVAWFGPRVTNYLRSVSITARSDDNAVESALLPNDDMPTATITAVSIRGSVGNASITLGTDELKVYSHG
tara:strand:- start:291 stop:824 length:534 start_codon:yes stop_codon:yes gene_type:complete